MSKIKPPRIEFEVGIGAYKSKTLGIGGRIKEIPEDFIVEEITLEGRILEADLNFDSNATNSDKICDDAEMEYLHFTLQKRNWDTLRAIREISKRLKISRKRFGFAGTKDKRAVTTQRVSVWRKTIHDLEKIRITDIVLRDFKYRNERINLGDLWGNRFTIRIRNIDLEHDEIVDRISRIINELDGKIPNFFGPQRFGTTRPITHLVGKEILKGNFERAVMLYIAEVFDEESRESRDARAILKENMDFKSALRKFPKYLGYEKAMLNFLVRNSNDFIGALRRLPKRLRMMFIHAYQSYIFNKSLSRYIIDGIFVEKLPLVGYETEIDEITSEILEEEGISREHFRVNRMPELSSRGSYRDCFVDFKNFKLISIENDKLNEGKLSVVIQFSLPRGSYATILIRELTKNRYW